jgi:hypothetical protein
MWRVLLLAGLLLLAVPTGASPAAHYVPKAGDAFSYNETIAVSNGVGNYSGYSDSTSINGSFRVTAVAANGTESARYYNSNFFEDNSGDIQTWTSGGAFTFSATSFLYVQGTDNQTGYTNPTVWFYMDNSLGAGAPFTILNTGMKVVSTSFNYDLGTAAGGYVTTIFAEGNGTYERNDAYGMFSAAYNWKAYFDPTTGYVVGYLYSETDTDGAGDGFSVSDVLGVTSTTYALTPGSSPSSSTGSSPSFPLVALLGILIVIVVLVVVVALILRARRHRTLPTHSSRGQVQFPSAGPPRAPIGPAPPPVSLTPSGQPAVQQIVMKETVKVNCRYCGALIDTTAEKCPFCGAART